MFTDAKGPFVYIIDPFYCNFIKIGKWNSSIDKLQSRYQTYYGKNIKIFAYDVKNCDKLEGIILSELSAYKIDPRCELLKKKYLEYYKTVFKKCCKTDYITCEKKPNNLHVRIKKISYKIILHQELLKMFNITSLESLEDKIIERTELCSYSENIKRIYEIAFEGGLIRQKRNSDISSSLRNASETLRTVLKVFKLTITRKIRQKRVGGKIVDISKFIIRKNRLIAEPAKKKDFSFEKHKTISGTFKGF